MINGIELLLINIISLFNRKKQKNVENRDRVQNTSGMKQTTISHYCVF